VQNAEFSTSKDVIVMKKIAYTGILLLLLAGVILFAGCTQPQIPPVTPTPVTPTPLPDTIKVVANPQYGQILVDANGRTLYYFARDTPGAGKSVCTAGCPGAWPPFDAPAVRVSPPLQATNFGEFARPDGSKQTTYMGWPLYYYSADKAPGDTNGYDFNKVWYVMSPTGVVTLAPTTTIATTRPTTVPTTVYYGGGGGY
jgi:predicted lipoprotein with Yx(FWY)xxD motif